MIKAILTGLALAAGLNASVAMACMRVDCIAEEKKPCQAGIASELLACSDPGCAGNIVEEKKPCTGGVNCVVDPAIELACSDPGCAGNIVEEEKAPNCSQGGCIIEPVKLACDNPSCAGSITSKSV